MGDGTQAMVEFEEHTMAGRITVERRIATETPGRVTWEVRRAGELVSEHATKAAAAASASRLVEQISAQSSPNLNGGSDQGTRIAVGGGVMPMDLTERRATEALDLVRTNLHGIAQIEDLSEVRENLRAVEESIERHLSRGDWCGTSDDLTDEEEDRRAANRKAAARAVDSPWSRRVLEEGGGQW